ncbi:DUF2330 domain-containing protein [Nannocystis radixulma]|uniref:DUF2330 domain-containing protein n=1 Tax=Nannocystis radixulma TaxID=2995305 RepID=A0ABT5BCR7_9BACT|nr:DUF2330 domain-containing protein [Nannocystis radixulma]MDC0671934.1 DUF2330 domain-containing protein [Nannocystis radixulma]
MSVAVPATSLAVLALASRPASACGGLFCDIVDGTPQPVDQTGENILFVVDRAAETVEAHIQIEYTGDPDEFAWIIPVTAVPEFSIGSEKLFDNLLTSTAPRYGWNFNLDCPDGPDGVCCICGGDGKVAEQSGWTDDGGDSDDGVEVIKRDFVGAYEIVTLQSGDAQELWDWLSTHGYYENNLARPVIDAYVAEGFYFAAARLRHGAGVEEIQPLVVKYSGTEPCVPLRLTKIAATDDMGVRVFALAKVRVAPSNYRHVELNDVRIDWLGGADNYAEVVTAAVDVPGADGHAFITEYAGSSDIVVRAGLVGDAWDPESFRALTSPAPADGPTVIDVLAAQGLVDCSGDACVYDHPQVLSLLRTYVPAPASVAEDAFYKCLRCHESDIDANAWSAEAFAQAMEERIVAPGQHADELLEKWPYLTRMFTIISRHEMTVDPEFLENASLPEVDNVHTAEFFLGCGGTRKTELPSERTVLSGPGGWPDFPEAMPYALRVEQIAPAGAPQLVQDFAPAIDAALRASNSQFSYDDGKAGCALGRGSLFGAAPLMVVFAVAWHGRRRRRV